MYQQITIVGNVGKEPELKEVGGTKLCEFSVAVSRKWTTSGGEKREETTWFKVTQWGKGAEASARYLSKGRQVLVVGEVSVSAYVSKSGEAQASLGIRASTVQFIGGGEKRESAVERDEFEDVPF